MLWEAPALCGFAEAAGWQRDDVVTAVAVILATSGGDDAYNVTHGLPPIIDIRGLFGLDVRTYPALEGERLYDPNVNARAAHELWEIDGRSWSWAAAHRSGAYRFELTEARDAFASGVRGQLANPFGQRPGVRSALRRVSDAIAAGVRTMSGPPPGVGRRP